MPSYILLITMERLMESTYCTWEKSDGRGYILYKCGRIFEKAGRLNNRPALS